MLLRIGGPAALGAASVTSLAQAPSSFTVMAPDAREQRERDNLMQVYDPLMGTASPSYQRERLRTGPFRATDPQTLSKFHAQLKQSPQQYADQVGTMTAELVRSESHIEVVFNLYKHKQTLCALTRYSLTCTPMHKHVQRGRHRNASTRLCHPLRLQLLASDNDLVRENQDLEKKNTELIEQQAELTLCAAVPPSPATHSPAPQEPPHPPPTHTALAHRHRASHTHKHVHRETETKRKHTMMSPAQGPVRREQTIQPRG